ncbi:MAG TPA: hypothetical protein VL970_05910 [Candidatus Acidoferrales bacterium]|nr:hypothetical protein [Candidatus Acidoferrales bacterium]
MALAAGELVHAQMAPSPFVGVYPGQVLGNPGSVIANPAAQLAPETLDQQEQPNEMQVFQPAGVAGGNALPEIFRYGWLQLHPQASYSFSYGNGIEYAPGSQEKLIIQQLSPGILIDLGQHWALDYTPTFQFYSSSKFADNVNQSVALTGMVDYEAWTFGLSHSTQITSEPMVETAAQTDTETHTTTVSASRALNSQISTDFAVNQTIMLVSGFDNSFDWNTLDWINYEFWPRLNAGLGAGGGYVLVENNGQGNGQVAASGQSGSYNQYYEQVQGRLNWRATDKISFQISGGLEDRQFELPGAGDTLDPLFSVTIQYQPFKFTQISLTASRTTAASDFYLASQQTETTLVGLNVSQRLWRKYTLGAGISYSQLDYSTPSFAAAAEAANRTDDLVTFNVQLSHPFYKRGTWSLFYQYLDDTSSQAGYSFHSSQVGFSVSYSF